MTAALKTSAESDVRDQWLTPPWSFPYRIVRHDLAETLRSARPYVSGKLLDLACGPKPYASLFQDLTEVHWGMDLGAWEGSVDTVGDVERLPFADRSFDTVLCTEGLEHFRRPHAVLAEIRRVLAPNGAVILSTPMTWGLHAEPYDYWRFTIHGLRQLAADEGLEVVASWRRGGGAKVIGQMLARWIEEDTTPQQTRLRSWLVRTSFAMLSPLARADALLRQRTEERSLQGLHGILEGRISRLPLVAPGIALVNRLATSVDRRIPWAHETIGYTVVLKHRSRAA